MPLPVASSRETAKEAPCVLNDTNCSNETVVRASPSEIIASR